MLLEFAESGHPIFRATTPLSRGQLKSKGRGKLSIHFTADQDTVDTIYRLILSVNQLGVYGAVAAICKEFEDHQDRTVQLVILVGQSIVLGEVKAETLVHDEDPRNDQIICQQYIQQVESLSPENRVSKFCKEAGFMRVVEAGPYFVTKDTGDFRQFQSVACRKYTLPRDDPASQPKGWIQGNKRIGPVLDTTATIPIHQRRWIDIEPSKQDLESYDHSKIVINLLRHNQTLHREEDGAIQFYKVKFHLRDHHSQKQNWSDDRWKACFCLAAGGGSKRRYQCCSDNSGTII